MKESRRLYYQLILSFILSICLLSGCTFGEKGGETAPSVSETSAAQSEPSYEQYEEKTLTAQRDFDALSEDLFRDEASSSLLTLHYTLADPAAYGITDYDNTLGTFSLEDSKQVILDAKSLNDELNEIDSRLLREDQRLTYTILSSFLNTLLSSEGMELYEQPLSSSLGIQAQLPILLSEYTFYSAQDVEDYLSLLCSIDTYYDSIIAFEKERTDAGLGLCDTVIDRIIESCNAYLLDAEHSFMTETFSERLDQLAELTPEEKKDYEARNLAAIDEHFVPAYQKLVEGLTALKGKGTNELGLFHYPRGKEYYQYLVNSATGTSYKDIQTLKNAITAQMVKDLQAMDKLLTEHPDIGERKMLDYAFRLTEPDAIMEDLRQQCRKDFPAIDDYVCNIKDVPKALEPILSPAFYLTVPIDRPQDNSIYINNGTTTASQNLYTTLAHEGYPGHMYQTLYFNACNDCNLRKLLSFSSYTEGWATYVEYYAYGLDNGLEPALGELLMHNASFTLALYGILDINIHYDGWDVEQVKSYLDQYFSISDPDVITTIYYDIAENPSNYLEYYVGYLEIINMKEEAMKTLGDHFQNMDFHRFLLDMGPAPFSVIQPYFKEWLIKQTSENSIR